MSILLVRLACHTWSIHSSRIILRKELRTCNMADNTTSAADLRGRCPPPFYDAAQFGFGGCTYSHSHLGTITNEAVVDGRFCAPVGSTGLVCCLPCPMTDFLYPSSECPLPAHRCPSPANDESRFQHGVPCRRSPQCRWSCIAGLHVDHICRPTGREDTPPLSQLLSHHRRNLHGCKFHVNHWRQPHANIP